MIAYAQQISLYEIIKKKFKKVKQGTLFNYSPQGKPVVC